MSQIVLLIILLAHGGYWFGDRENTIHVEWSQPKVSMPAAVLSWQLTFGQVQLATGEQDVPAGETGATIRIKLPPIRATSELSWHYQLKSKDTGKELESGKRAIHAYPNDLLSGVAKRLDGKKVVVLDVAEGLPAILTAGGVKHRRIEGLSELDLSPADVVLVGENQLPEQELAQKVLITQARSGASVLILAQSKPDRLTGYRLAERALKEPLVFQEKHPVFAGLSVADLGVWLGEATGGLRAIALPADEPIFALAAWPRETPGDRPVPIDALITTQSLGRGRIVLCQMPLGTSKDDPRSQIFLANALDYLLTRPEPTPSPSARAAATQPAATKPAATVNTLFPTGDKP